MKNAQSRLRARRNSGFTLIELLVAVSVLAVVAVMGWRGLDTIIRARVALNSELEQTRGLQLTFAQMQNDLAKIAQPAEVGNAPVLLTTPQGLSLVRMVYAENQPTRVQVVSYQLRNGVLQRLESLPTRDLAQLQQAWTNINGANVQSITPVQMQTGIERIDLRLWYPQLGWRPINFVPPATRTATGVEVGLELNSRPGVMQKIFMLGTA